VGSLARKKSSELILKKIDEVNNTLYPVVLMGDLNSLPNSTPIQVLKFQLSDAQEISSTTLYGPVGTFNGFDKDLKIDKRIDYFFTSKMKTLSYAHIDDRLDDNKHISDHLPVLIKIKIISPMKNKVRQQ
jgi:endonuclease/exonuclease/phosphatase family metal-dependent hydrolase